MILTYRFRLSDTCNGELTRQARAVNMVWNFCNETQQKAVNYRRKWLSWQDLQNLTSGSYEELDISANTIQMVCREYDSSRQAKKKRWLNWRVSNQKSAKRSLGWIPLGLAKTNMAKSVLDTGWGKFRSQLAYKAIRHQVVYKEVNEAYSTQTCSSCGNRTGPRGLNSLGIREWTCSDCGTTHDRDVNAAKNIVRCELATLAEGILM